ncbi:MAG: NAD(+)/NADH kinase [Promethearchaeota archaeon]
MGIVVRPDFSAGIEHAQKLLKLLEKKKMKVLMPVHLAKTLKRPGLGCSLDKMHADFVVTLGGDGTLLFAARSLPPRVPLLPVNLHSFGFLSEGEIEEAMDLIGEVLDEAIEIQETLRFALWYKDERLPDATNEIFLFPVELGHPIVIKLQIGENTPISFQGDGLIIATPTGSTGHARSLGGPVLDSQIDAFLLIPDAPLRHSFLPLIVPAVDPIHIEVEKSAHLVIDGDPLFKVRPNTQVTIRKSEHPLRIFRHKNSFYSRLQRKLLRC